MRSFSILSVLVLAASASCGGSSHGSSADAGVDAPGPPVATTDIPLAANRDVDLLFMIDNSPSMADKQANLASGFPALVSALSAAPGLPNLHIGVVTSDLGTSAADGQVGPALGTIGQGGCTGQGGGGKLEVSGAPITGAAFLSDIGQPDGMRVKNYTGTLTDAFAAMSSVGAAGCGFEQPLEAVKRALSPATAGSAGFLRPGAVLAVLLLTDEDDCSLAHTALIDPTATGPLGPLQSFRCTRFGITCKDGGATPDQMNMVGVKDRCSPVTDTTYLTDVAGYAAFLHGLKADPSKVVVDALVGPAQPVAVELRAPQPSQPVIPALAHACSYVANGATTEVADPAVRIHALLDQFPGRSDGATICQSDLSGALAAFATTIRSALGDPCLQGQLADADAATPGVQATCKVDVKLATGKTSPLPLCTPADATATNPPCWHLVTDATQCATTPSHLRLAIEGQAKLAPDAHVIASCQI